MSVIYKPKGKALEYSDLACNLYNGCQHGCLYCYAPLALRVHRDEYHAIANPRVFILEKLKKEAPKHKGKEVFLCFSCDPYGIGDSTTTREAIKILHSCSVGVNILTKGGERATRDFDLLSTNPQLSRIGATLTFDNDDDSSDWEPNAALPSRRFSMLAQAKAKGIRTWVSLEPVIVPEQTLSLIKSTHSYVDHYKVGRWNYDKRANNIDWADFLRRVTTLLDKYGASYYIKKDLAVFSDKGLE
jgi:DNA repair photolyase